MKQVLPLLILLLATPLAAQFDDDRLYIPPKITVGGGFIEERPAVIEMNESFRPEMLCLIPVLFFDYPGSYEIPERYQQFRSKTEAASYADTIGVPTGNNPNPRFTPKYYEILDIVGYRLRRHRDATLHLRGAHSTEPGDSPEIANERANVIREYLMRVWEIDESRITLLDPIRACDTLDNVALQEEARRVEFASDDPAILAPVLYPRVGHSGPSSMLRILLEPNMRPEEIDSIEVRMLDEREETAGVQAIAGHPDSTNYVIYASWQHKDPTATEAMRLVVRIRDRAGRYRASNIVPIPVRIKHREERSYDHPVGSVVIPFGFPGDTVISTGQRRAIEDALAQHHELASPENLEDLVFILRGNADLAEHPGREAPEVNIELQTLKMRPSSIEWNRETEPYGILQLMDVVFDEKTKMVSYGTIGFEGSFEEIKREVDEKNRKEKKEMRSRPDLHLADTIAIARARNVLATIVDSLGASTAIGDVPVAALESYGRIKTDFLGSTLDQSTQSSVVLLLQQGIEPPGMAGKEVWILPEARFYSRSATIDFTTKRFMELFIGM